MTAIIPNITPDFDPKTADEFDAARQNFRWWAANFQLIADKNAPAPHLFHWNTIQQRLDHIIQTHRNVFGGGRYLIVKARQMGISTYCTLRSGWKACSVPNFRGMHVAHETDASELMLTMVKLSYNALPELVTLPSGEPPVLVKPVERTSRRNELEVGFDQQGTLTSRILIKTAGAGEGVGRAFALNLLHFSEVGDHKAYDNGRVVGGSLQTLARSAEVFAEGTPNGAYGLEYEMYQDAKSGDNGWIPIFLPWFWMNEYSIPILQDEVIEADNEFEHMLMQGKNTHEGYKVQPTQIKWMRWKMKSDCPKTVEMTPQQWFMQEYAHNDYDCFLMSGSSFFVGEYISKMAAFATEYEKANKIKRYSLIGDKWIDDPYGPLRLIEEPIAGATYVIGGDAAKGTASGDYDTATIIKRVVDGPDWVVGYWRTHEPDKGLHAYALAQMGFWHNKALIAVENNPMGHGNSVNSHLAQMNYPNIYVQSPDDEARYSGGLTPEYGFHTSHKSKGIYLGDMQTSLRYYYRTPGHADGIVIPFSAIIGEFRAFQKVEGKTQAAAGNYDDLVISTSIANHLCPEVTPKFRNKPRLDQPRVSGLTLGQIIECSAGKKVRQKFERLISHA